MEAHQWVVGAYALLVRARVATYKGLHARTQVVNRVLVDGLHLRQRTLGIGVACGGCEWWDVDHAHVRRMGDQVVSWLGQQAVSSAVMPA